MKYLSVKNFDKNQHYRDRNPPWIKLYNSLLDDYHFGQLDDASKGHLVAIMLLASRSNNKIPHDSKWIQTRISAHEPINLDLLIEVGFIVEPPPKSMKKKKKSASKKIAARNQDACPEQSRDRGREEGKQNIYTDDFEKFWKEFPGGRKTKKPQAFKKYDAIVKRTDVTPEMILEGVAAYKEYHNPEFVMLPVTWLNGHSWEDDPAENKPCSKDTPRRRPNLTLEQESQIDDLRLKASNALQRGDVEAFKDFHKKASQIGLEDQKGVEH